MTPSPRYQPVRIDVRTNHEFGLCMEFPPTNIPRSDTSSTDGEKIAKEAARRQQRRNANQHLITALELLRLQQENTQRLLLNPPPPTPE